MSNGSKCADIDLAGVEFADPLDPQLFNEIAKRCARTIADSENKRNKPSQLRRFYDELVMWNTKAEQHPGEEAVAQYLPFILMLNAKAAYAEGRELVDANFVTLLSHCLRQVKDARTLALVKLFFEAFLGFYKAARPRDS
ncbi:MAG: type III-A CRISPR-associated protein Csm2 [Thiohalocapsa sp.]|nr:type III-A CRISPR-associated protein Csm2 [Thiohalocapsa sp.]